MTKETEALLQDMYGSSALKLRQIQRIYRLCAGLCADDAAAAAADQRRVNDSRARPARDQRTVALIRDAVSANPRATLEDLWRRRRRRRQQRHHHLAHPHRRARPQKA